MVFPEVRLDTVSTSNSAIRPPYRLGIYTVMSVRVLVLPDKVHLVYTSKLVCRTETGCRPSLATSFCIMRKRSSPDRLTFDLQIINMMQILCNQIISVDRRTPTGARWLYTLLRPVKSAISVAVFSWTLMRLFPVPTYPMFHACNIAIVPKNENVATSRSR